MNDYIYYYLLAVNKSQICNWCTGDTAGADWCGVPGTVDDEVKL